ncbi:protein LTV1 [Trichonephila inaurata madagascariensis]|uniref:Protein LTV1 homolog n=1 Tax=Trichonephila inaurata madagascariensis TaxID=2747483 RepID=A0A8X6XQQ9_9ARAC|nr:protein LTV1 [Trichonephila inaurata madagascariensis]
MPSKRKRVFTRHNSQKFLLITEGRDEKGEKITQNVLVPVPYNHVSGSSLAYSNLAGPCGPPQKKEPSSKDIPKMVHGKLSKMYERVEDGDLEGILGQMTDSGDEDDGNYNIRAKLERMNFFSEADSSSKPYSNVQVEIFEEDEDEFSDDLHQFSDCESDEEFNNFQKKYPFTSRKEDCPEAIRLFNEGFEKVLLEYTEDHIGALDDEEVCGGTFSTKDENVMKLLTTPLYKNPDIGEFDEQLKEKVLLYAEVEQPEKIVEIVTVKPIDFDCESIASTYSNIYNHPTVIKEVSKIKKIKIPNNPLKKGLTRTTSYMRVKGETPEQRKERKKLIKEERKECRKLKKENKLAFKEEKKLQVAQALNVWNTKGLKLL